MNCRYFDNGHDGSVVGNRVLLIR